MRDVSGETLGARDILWAGNCPHLSSVQRHDTPADKALLPADFAAGQLVPTDWVGLAAHHPDRIASLTLVAPRPGRPELDALGSRLMVLAGDSGPSAQRLPGCSVS